MNAPPNRAAYGTCPSRGAGDRRMDAPPNGPFTRSVAEYSVRLSEAKSKGAAYSSSPSSPSDIPSSFRRMNQTSTMVRP